MAKATITKFGLVPGTTRDVYATWTWDGKVLDKNRVERTDHYEVRVWYRLEGIDGSWEASPGNTVTTTEKRYQYTAPENATKVIISVKPVSKTYKVKDVDTAYWTAEWSTQVGYDFSKNPPATPPVPEVDIEGSWLTARVENLAIDADTIEFQIVSDDNEVEVIASAPITTTTATYGCMLSYGHEYKVRCRSKRGSLYSEWSEYSSNVGTAPKMLHPISSIKATSSTSVYLAWSEVQHKNSYTYDVEFATKKEYLGTPDKSDIVTGIKTKYYEKTGLETGSEYFFRYRIVNEVGASGWSGTKSVVLGKKPSAPTTWSSTTTAMVFSPLTLYWTHNAEDNSRQTFAELEITTIKDGIEDTSIVTIDDTANDLNEDVDDVMSYSINTSTYFDGFEIRWRVRTAGVTKEYSDWSIRRTVKIYAPPTLSMVVRDQNGPLTGDVITSLPIQVICVTTPDDQTPLGYHLTVISNEKYYTDDYLGNPKIVNEGEVIYSKYFNRSNLLNITLSAGDLNLDNNMSYTIECTASMDSGLVAKGSRRIVASWNDDYYHVNAEIGVDERTYSAYIKPYCIDLNSGGELADKVTLAVYRREFDGKFTEIASGLENTDDIFVTDPHPALDYARYRIVATSKTTGAVSYYDPPGYPVACKSVILQWDDTWTNFNTVDGELDIETPWTGSMLQLHYNIDVTEQTDPDVVLVKYIGREHPVGYYGTQVGQSASWSMTIPKSDKDTLYALRRLSTWMGNVYVREPSGSGYWAKVNVSYSQKHKSVTIPVTLDITRVEGGV